MFTTDVFILYLQYVVSHALCALNIIGINVTFDDVIYAVFHCTARLVPAPFPLQI